MRTQSNKATNRVRCPVSTESLAALSVTALLSPEHRRGWVGVLYHFLYTGGSSASNWVWPQITCHGELLIKLYLHQNCPEGSLKPRSLGSFWFGQCGLEPKVCISKMFPVMLWPGEPLLKISQLSLMKSPPGTRGKTMIPGPPLEYLSQ